MNTKSYLYLIRLKVNRISRLDFIVQTWGKLEGSPITPNVMCKRCTIWSLYPREGCSLSDGRFRRGK